MQAVLNYKRDRGTLFFHFCRIIEGNYLSNNIIVKYFSKILYAIKLLLMKLEYFNIIEENHE